MVASGGGPVYIVAMSMGDISQRMAALGSPARLEIYRLLVRAGDGGLAVASLQKRLGIPASTLSHHLHRLIGVGLVWQERSGTSLLCRADYEIMRETFELFARECCVDGDCRPGAPEAEGRGESCCAGGGQAKDTDKKTM